MQWKKDTEYVCILAKSPAYRVGEVYKTYINDKNQMCLKGRDGIEDIVGNLLSGFRVYHD